MSIHGYPTEKQVNKVIQLPYTKQGYIFARFSIVVVLFLHKVTAHFAFSSGLQLGQFHSYTRSRHVVEPVFEPPAGTIYTDMTLANKLRRCSKN